MSHVDEGELTAYADGAYPAASAEAHRIEAHIASCANCRNRLEQARVLTGRAAEILAAAAPIDITVPDFAQVRAAAQTVRRRRNAIPLTWAATVILALGLGWFGRGALFQSQPRTAKLANTPTAETASQPAPADMAAAAPEPAPAPPMLSEATATGAARTRNAAVVPPERTELQAANAVEQASVAAAEPASRVTEEKAESGRAAGLVAQDAAVRNVDYMTPADAERRGIALHAVPELEILRVGVRGPEVMVEQKLPDGKLITITAIQTTTQTASKVADRRQAEMAVAPAAPPAARVREDLALRSQVAAPVIEVTRAGVTLRVSGPVPEDSLRALAARIR